jgi:tetratricopeptide (TPR) repeat protein
MIPFLLLALSPAVEAPASAADFTRAVVEIAEEARRAGRLDLALRVLDAGAPLVLNAAPADRLRLRLSRARSVYYRSSLAGTPHDATILELRSIVAEAQTLGDAALLADARDQLGIALYGSAFRASDMAEPRALFDQVLQARRAADDRRGTSEALFHVGLTWENKKDPTPEDVERAKAAHREALQIAEAGGFDVEASYAVRHLAGHQQEAGDLDAAIAGFERSLALREKAGYAIYYAPSLIALGDAWKEKGDRAKARACFERAKIEADRLQAARFQQMAQEALATLDK